MPAEPLALRLARRIGDGDDDRMRLAGIPVERLADEYGTPLYVYHAGVVRQQVARVRSELGPDVDLLYSVKANPSLGLCQLLARERVGAELASAGELHLARAAGFDPDRIVLAGPGKTDAELDLAVRCGIQAVHVESLPEIDRLARTARRAGQTAGVRLRLNPARPLSGSLMRMGGVASQFGIEEADLGEAVGRVLAHPGLELRGVHVYTATQVFDTEALLDQCQRVLELAAEVAELSQRPLMTVDFGAGFGVPCFEGMPEFDLARFGAGFRELWARHRARTWARRLVVELGRYLVAEAGLYVTRVIDVKRSRERVFAITDGGMHQHLAATGNLGQVFRKPYPLLNLTRPGPYSGSDVTVTGCCCTPLDVFGRLPLGPIEVGDLIGVFCSGAYAYSASNLLFLSHPAPAEVLVGDGEVHLLRPAGTPEDVLRGQRPLGGGP